MRLSEVSWAEGELPADSVAGGGHGSAITAKADRPDLASRPRPDWPGRDQPDGSRSLVQRLARLPEAHPSAWSAGARSALERFPADWAGARTGGDPAREDTWWRGESDIWWRAGSIGEDAWWRGESDGGGDADPDDPGELADRDDLADSDGPAEAGWAADADATDETDDQGNRPVRPVPGRARPDHGTQGGRRGGAGPAGPDQAGPDRGLYRPWFSADASGDPWFAAGLERWQTVRPDQR